MELTVELLRKVDNFDFFHLPTFEAAADFAAAQLVVCNNPHEDLCSNWEVSVVRTVGGL